MGTTVKAEMKRFDSYEELIDMLTKFDNMTDAEKALDRYMWEYPDGDFQHKNTHDIMEDVKCKKYPLHSKFWELENLFQKSVIDVKVGYMGYFEWCAHYMYGGSHENFANLPSCGFSFGNCSNPKALTDYKESYIDFGFLYAEDDYVEDEKFDINDFHFYGLYSDNALDRAKEAFKILNEALINGKRYYGIYINTPDGTINTWYEPENQLYYRDELKLGIIDPFEAFFGDESKYTPEQQKIRKAYREVYFKQIGLSKDIESIFKACRERAKTEYDDSTSMINRSEQQITERAKHLFKVEVVKQFIKYIETYFGCPKEEIRDKIYKMNTYTTLDTKAKKFSVCLYINYRNGENKVVQLSEKY